MPVSSGSQVFMLVSWLTLVLLMHLAVWPSLRLLSRDYALPLSFPVSLILSTLLSWYLALIGLPVHLVLVPLVVLLGYHTGRGDITITDLKEGRFWYILFLGVFMLTLGAKILFNPDIDISYEKFMDSMILSSMIADPRIPPSDAWFSGGFLSWYYYLGSWMFAIPAHILNIPAPVMYNLVIPTVFAASAVMIFAGAKILMNRFRYLPLFLLCISYPAFLLYIPIYTQNQIPLRMILDATVRIHPEVITENPLTALFIGSPRPYAVAMMIQCLLIFLLVSCHHHWGMMNPSSRKGAGLLLGIGLGTLLPLHSWDLLIYLPLIFFTGILISCNLTTEKVPGTGLRDQVGSWTRNLALALRSPSRMEDPSSSALVLVSILPPVLALGLYLPFLLDLENQRFQGVTLNPVPSDPFSFILTHGFFLLILLTAIRKDIIRSPLLLVIPVVVAASGFFSAALVLLPMVYLAARRFSHIEEILAFGGLTCIIFCEFFSMVQNGSADRANTTYKFYFASWILLGFSTLTLLGRALDRLSLFRSPVRYRVVSVILTGSALLFPLILLSGGLLTPPTLDGSAYAGLVIGDEELHALEYLRSLPPGEILVEGVVPWSLDQDTPAKYFSRVSALTGVPAVMGSFFREEVYRGNAVTAPRGEDSVSVYLHPEQAAEIMNRYNATLLYVGIPEISVYNVADPGIYAKYGFIPVFHENSTVIWRVPWYPG